ncbi:regulatory protein RecX [Melioribacter sp. Ez-97]|uniref:regulatory protein RecX n=1 Tax=Melioribacter sp. Ez-97 TaxID=3423434 RepID=UPI003ED8BEE3
MIINSLIRRNNKVKITFDDSSSLYVNYNVAVQFALRKGDVLDEHILNRLRKADELFEIKAAAYRLIGRRDHSSAELKRKLLKKGFDDSLIDELVKELSEKNYLNDFNFARKYSEEAVEKKKAGINKVRNELIKKGIGKEIIEDVLNDIDDNTMLENARDLLNKKMKTSAFIKTESRKKKQKLFSYLKSKGYASDLIMKLLSEYDFSDDE